jgi:serine/threonine protein kinase
MNERRPSKASSQDASEPVSSPDQPSSPDGQVARGEQARGEHKEGRGPLATLRNIVRRDASKRSKKYSLPPKIQSNPRSVTTDASPAQPDHPESLWSGRLKPGEEVGRGAMGFVLRATDTKLRRDLALKVSPAPREQLSRDQLARFIEEAQVTAQLEHPNVVPVHDIGVDPEGRVYFTMKLIRGQSLEAILDLRRAGDAETLAEFGLRRLLDVFLQACQAVEYAHARGVVHRDLKPANVMVGDFGEVLVMDWGVAKLMDRADRPSTIPPPPGALGAARAGRDGESGLLRPPTNPPVSDVTSVRAGKKGLETQLGTVIGTPAYMAPEQASGSPVDGRADLYALGVILYEILCGEVPFNDDDPTVILSQLLSQAPRPPSSINPSAPLALESLALRLLAKSPSERTLSVRQIRAHVQDYIEGFGRDYERESILRSVVWVGGALGLIAFLVWYLTGQTIGAVLVLAPPAVFNAFGWFLLVLSARYPLWAAYVALSHRGEHDRYRPPSEEELFVSGYSAHRTFAASFAPIFQLTFVVELITVGVAQARRGASVGVVEHVLTSLRAGWANALISIFVFLFAYLMLLAAEVRYARRIDRFTLFVGRASWESTWPSFLIFVLLLSIGATGFLDWALAPEAMHVRHFLQERVFSLGLRAFEVVKTLVFQGTFLIGLVGATLLVSFPFAEVLASLRLPFAAADEASVRSRQQYFLRSVAFFRLARASWLYGGAMISCLTAITILTEEARRPIAAQVLFISGPWLIGFAAFWWTRGYLLSFLANAPAVERMLEESEAEARREQAMANHAQVSSAPFQRKLAELAVPLVCVIAYLVWTGSAVDERAIRDLVLPVSTKGWLLILPYALMVPVLLGRDQVLAWLLRRRTAASAIGAF